MAKIGSQVPPKTAHEKRASWREPRPSDKYTILAWRKEVR